MYYLSLPKDIYISDTPPSDGSTLFWIKDTAKNAFIARGPRIPEVSSKLSANHFQTRIVGSDLLSVWQFDEAPEVMIYDTVADNWISYNATAGGDLVPSCLSWSVMDNEVQIVYCDPAYTGKLTIPAYIDGLPVTNIGPGCFSSCSNLTEVELPNTIHTLWDYSFAFCESLQKIILPDTITYIGYDAVYECNNVAFSTYGFCKYLGTDVSPYLYCFGLVQDAQEGCNCEIHSDTIVIQDNAFGSSVIGSLHIPGTVKALPASFCSGCYALTTVILEEGITSIGDYAFSGCETLEHITLPSSLRIIEDGAFSYCRSLSAFECPAGLATLGAWVFDECEALTTLTISDSVTKLDQPIFGYNVGLQEIIIGKGLASGLETCGIGECPITSIIIHEDNPSYSTDSYNVLYDKQKTLIYLASKQLGDYVMPDTVEKVCNNAFASCTATSIIASKNLREIGRYAFVDAELSSIKLFPSLETIDYGAFYFCTGLTTLELPSSVHTIGATAFEGSQLLEITIPGTVSDLGDMAFSQCMALHTISFESGIQKIPSSCCSYCTSLTTVNLPNTITSIEYGAFSKCKSLQNLVLPDSLVSLNAGAFSDTNGLQYCSTCRDYAGGRYIGTPSKPYLMLVQVNTASTVFNIHPDTEILGNYSFTGCTGITDITIPVGVTIGSAAFANCTGLVSVTLAEGITSTELGSCLFEGCVHLTSVTLPSSITTIPYATFRGCTSLTSITLPDSITTIGDSVFSGCKMLGSVKLSKSMTEISRRTFNGCTNLKSITIPDTITSIADYAFYKSGLQSINIPASVSDIGEECFAYCSSLASVTLNEGLEHIDDSGFAYCYSLTSIKLPNSLKSLNSGSNIAFWDDVFYNCSKLVNIYVPFGPDSKLAVRAPWGASKATVHYNYVD